MASRDVGNFGQHRIVPIAFDDRFLEIRMDRRLVRGEEARAEKNAVGAERERGSEADEIIRKRLQSTLRG